VEWWTNWRACSGWISSWWDWWHVSTKFWEERG